MSDTSKDMEKKVVANPVVDATYKVSLVELSLILLLVGLIFVFIFGMGQLKKDKASEHLAREKFEEIVPVFKMAIAAIEEYKRLDDFGEYPFDFAQLNIPASDDYTVEMTEEGSMYIDTADFMISYDGEDYILIAESKSSFGKAGIKVLYTMKDASYQVEDPSPERRPTVLDEWLPHQ